MENLYLTKNVTLKYHIKGLTFVCLFFLTKLRVSICPFCKLQCNEKSILLFLPLRKACAKTRSSETHRIL